MSLLDGPAPQQSPESGHIGWSHLSHSPRFDPHSIDERAGAEVTAITLEERNMNPTIRSLVVPVSDLDAAKSVYTALFGTPHTDQPYYVGYNVDGFEVALAPGEVAGGPVAYADVEGPRRDPRNPAPGWRNRARRPTQSRARCTGLCAHRPRRQPDRPARPVAVGDHVTW